MPPDEPVVGAARLVVPKGGGRSLTTGSFATADDESGVSAVYKVIVCASVQPPPTDAVRILGDEIGQRVWRGGSGDESARTTAPDRATGARRVEALRALRAAPARLGFFDIAAPLEL